MRGSEWDVYVDEDAWSFLLRVPEPELSIIVCKSKDERGKEDVLALIVESVQIGVQSEIVEGKT
jgi:hypothetical protein